MRAVLVVAAASLALVGCGGDDTGDPIPRGKAQTMEQQLDAIRAAVEEGRCEAVGPAVGTLQTTIATLDSDGVGDDVQDALGDGAGHLRSLAGDDCQPEEEETETIPEEPEPTVPEEPEPTVPEPTTTEEEPVPPPPEEPEPVPPEEPEEPVEPPPDEGSGEGQFDPGGGGGGIPPGQLKKDDD